MTLNDYLKLHGISDGEFAARVKRERTTVMRWRKGDTRPDWEALEAIHEASGGAVRPNDFFPPEPLEPSSDALPSDCETRAS